MSETFVSLLDLLALVQGVLLGILLMSKWRKHISYLLLGIFLFCYSAELSVTILMDLGYISEYPILLYLPTTFYFWFMPALHLYVISLTRPINWQIRKWQFLPGLLESVLLLILFLQPTAKKIEQIDNEFAVLFYNTYTILAVLHGLVYIGIVLKEIHTHQQQVDAYYSNSNGRLLNWVRWICYFLGFILLTLVSQSMISDAFIQQYHIYPFFSALNLIFIFWIALSGIQQKVSPIHTPLPTILTSKPSENTPDRQADTSEQDQIAFQKIVAYISTNRTYTQPDLHLANLAQQVHLPQRRLSELINQQGGMNFKQFINKFRVEAAKKLLLDPDFAHYNMLGIAYEVGFNSKATFYSVFKQSTTFTPLQFQKKSQLS